MTRDAKTQSALIALARSRRMQRALAHAYLHRGAPMTSLRSSLGYMTTTLSVAGDPTEHAPAVGHHMTLLGVSRMEGVAYVVEELGDEQSPIVYRLFLAGPREGYLVPIHAWYEQRDDVAEIRARIAAITPTLEPAMTTTTEAWMLSTRIVQRRAIRVAGPGPCADLPIRKYALQLMVEPVSGPGPSGKTTVTAFLRPGAQLADVWALAGSDAAIARVTYTGIPSGIGLAKDTVILLTSGVHGVAELRHA